MILNVFNKVLFFLLLALPALASSEGGHEGPNISGLLWRVSVFAMFVGLLYYLLAKRVKDGLAQSSENIKKAIEDAEIACKTAEEELADYNIKISAMTRELEEMKESAKETAEAEKKRILAEAEKSAAKYKEAAEAAIKGELAKASADLKTYASLAAIEQAEKTIAADADKLAGQKYIAGIIQKIGA